MKCGTVGRLLLSSRKQEIVPAQSHLDELTDRIQWLERQSFGKKIIHIVDREADSVKHLRQWRASGASWLVRIKEGSSVNYDGFDVRTGDVANDLTYREIGTVNCKGKLAKQSVASTNVVLTRKAKSKKGVKEVEATPLPVQRHTGEDIVLLQQRTAVYEQAKTNKPERWSGDARDWSHKNEVWLNPSQGQANDEMQMKKSA